MLSVAPMTHYSRNFTRPSWNCSTSMFPMHLDFISGWKQLPFAMVSTKLNPWINGTRRQETDLLIFQPVLPCIQIYIKPKACMYIQYKNRDTKKLPCIFMCKPPIRIWIHSDKPFHVQVGQNLATLTGIWWAVIKLWPCDLLAPRPASPRAPSPACRIQSLMGRAWYSALEQKRRT